MGLAAVPFLSLMRVKPLQPLTSPTRLKPNESKVPEQSGLEEPEVPTSPGGVKTSKCFSG